jgi:predicted Zn-ribbon and HTH transcriptional regulator
MTSTLRCRNCGRDFPLEAPGTRNRNHCPHCLHSVHLDNTPGDRAARCGGIMEPLAVAARRNGEWLLIHRCRKCGTLHANRSAGDDNAVALMQIAVRPLATPPFPELPVG